MRIAFWGISIAVSLLLAGQAQAGAKYKVIELKPAPGYNRGVVGNSSFGLNNSGQSVGRMGLTGFVGDHAAVWDSHGHGTLLAVPDDAWFSKADDINSSGVMAGEIGIDTPADDNRRAARWTTPGHYEFFLPDNGHRSSADVINDNGWIAGFRFNTSADEEENLTGYVWSPDGTTRWIDATIADGQIEFLGGNNANMFVGQQASRLDMDGTSFSGVVWSEAGGVTVLPTRDGFIFTAASAINDAGIAIGNDWDGDITDTGLWWDAAHNVHTLGFLPGMHSSVVSAINNHNLIVGWSGNAADCDPFAFFVCRRASLFDLNGHAYDLNDLIDPSLGYTLLFANGINDHGAIYGEALDASGRRFLFLAQPVPEPTSWAMLVAGFGLAGAALRRRRVAMA